MKIIRESRWSLLFLILAAVLVLTGLAVTYDAFRDFDYAAFARLDHEQLLELFRLSAVKLLLGGGVTATGLGMGTILFMHLLRRTVRMERETRALRRRNQEMERLIRQKEELAHHQRLETLGTLTSSIAHEFNNLLTPIMGYSMMALEKLPAEEDGLYDDILEIYNASRKAKTIISRLSDLSRKNTAVAFRLVSLDELVKKTLDVAGPARPLKAELKLNLNCWDQRLLANEIQIQQMLLNLILNGFHALGDQPGSLTIETSFDEHNLHLLVADTGCGIPEDIRKRIFEPFFTTKESGKGTGLGLAIVAQVIADHHGHIRVDSRAGEGTRFSITLPRNQEPAKVE